MANYRRNDYNRQIVAYVSCGGGMVRIIFPGCGLWSLARQPNFLERVVGLEKMRVKGVVILFLAVNATKQFPARYLFPLEVFSHL